MFSHFNEIIIFDFYINIKQIFFNCLTKFCHIIVYVLSDIKRCVSVRYSPQVVASFATKLTYDLLITVTKTLTCDVSLLSKCSITGETII